MHSVCVIKRGLVPATHGAGPQPQSGKFGHTMDKCWGDNLPAKRAKRECANIACEDSDVEMGNVAELSVNNNNDDTVSFYPWFANSKTTSHITN